MVYFYNNGQDYSQHSKLEDVEIVIVDITFASKYSIDTLDLVEDLGKSDWQSYFKFRK